MKKYTLEDFAAFERDGVYITCPSGDYSGIMEFPSFCSFGEGCNFGTLCSFGERCSFDEQCLFGRLCRFGMSCSFGEQCSFGTLCSFGERCSFDRLCDFGERCSFGASCDFGEWCGFGEQCSFGEQCLFGEWCTFGEWCAFGKPCTCEDGKEFCDFLKFEGLGSEHRCTYFFKLTDGKIYVRCDCFAGYIDEFRAQVKETHGNSKFAKGYLKIADLAEWQFEEEGENADE